MSYEKLAPLLDTDIWRFLLGGLVVTVQVAILSIVISLVLGTVLAVCRLSPVRLLSWPARLYVEALRSLPPFLILVYVFFGTHRLGFELPTLIAVVLGLAAYHSAKAAEVVRAGILSIEKGQVEAARSLGLSNLETMFSVVFPQAFQRLLPPLVSELILIVKGTSIGSVLGLNELLKRAIITYQLYFNPLEMLFAVGIIYWTICFSLSRLGRRLETGGVQRAERRAAIAQQTMAGATAE
ncbi:MAG: amino acid ABC transporter permease [Chloroflexi bacterium]|nr:amino acid ABC transporter permease [Chloroflexota bacterium]